MPSLLEPWIKDLPSVIQRERAWRAEVHHGFAFPSSADSLHPNQRRDNDGNAPAWRAYGCNRNLRRSGDYTHSYTLCDLFNPAVRKPVDTRFRVGDQRQTELPKWTGGRWSRRSIHRRSE